MRDIKFRAWCPNRHVMYKVKNICFEGRAMATVEYRPILKIPVEYLYLEQFTGLHDKNGKEIYEGDRISKDYPFDESYPTVTETGEVKFMEGGFCLWFEDDHDAWHYLQETHSRHYVIGNIHENKDLLG